MTNLRKTLFISDLHLEEIRPEITQQFLQLLLNCQHGVDALYILGDLFETWIGDDDHCAFHQQIKQALKSATQYLPIYFLLGNRDFLIGKQFLHETGCQLLSDEQRIMLYGTPILLMHGDTLCTLDISYLKARSWLRNRFLQTLFLLLPLTFRKKIASKIREKSQRHTQSTDIEIMDVTQSEVVRVMQKHQVKFMIHGHTHRPDTHEFTLDCTHATRIVLGAWHERGHVLVWRQDGEKELGYL